jgi:RNA polymerase sigma-70 factor (ECF subfamily)
LRAGARDVCAANEPAIDSLLGHAQREQGSAHAVGWSCIVALRDASVGLTPDGRVARYMPDAPRSRPDVTRLLKEWSNGQRDVLDQLFALIYDELRGLARSHLRRESRHHTLQPTELVHEAFGRLVAQKVSWQNRGHFYGIAAKCMRRILVDYARKKRAAKRPTSGAAVELDDGLVAESNSLDRMVAVDEALERLAAVNPRQAQVVELKYFAGLSIEEIAQVAGVSPATVKRDWEEAKLVLLRSLGS